MTDVVMDVDTADLIAELTKTWNEPDQVITAGATIAAHWLRVPDATDPRDIILSLTYGQHTVHITVQTTGRDGRCMCELQAKRGRVTLAELRTVCALAGLLPPEYRQRSNGERMGGDVR